MPIYNEFRPEIFDDVVGQESSVAILRKEIMEDTVPNALLLSGLRGSGKTTISRILSKAVNCENPVNGNPCMRCTSCMIIAQGCTDIVELDGASNNSVESIRELIQGAQYVPSVLKYKVYIIDEAHMLSSAAFNALLKTLEEPPAHSKFILCTTERQKILPTIASRCQRLEFRTLSVSEIEGRINYILGIKNYSMEPDAVRLIAIGAGGSLRDSLSDLDKCISANVHTAEDVQRINGIIPEECFFDALKAYAKKDIAAILTSFNGLDIEQVNKAVAVSTFLDIIADRMTYLTSSRILDGLDKTERYKEQVRSLELDYTGCLALMEILNTPFNELRYSFIAAVARAEVLEEPKRMVESLLSGIGNRPAAEIIEEKPEEPAETVPESAVTTKEPVPDTADTETNDDFSACEDDENPFDDEPDEDGDEEPACRPIENAFDGFNMGFPW